MPQENQTTETVQQTAESTDTQQTVDDLLGVDDVNQEAQPPEAEQVTGEQEQTATSEEPKSATQEQEPTGTPLSAELQEKYGVKTEEELISKLKKAENADKALSAQGRELGELRKAVAEIQQRRDEGTQANEVAAYQKQVREAFEGTSKALQKALTDESFDVSELGKTILGQTSTFIAEHVVKPIVDSAIREYDGFKTQMLNQSQQVTVLRQDIDKNYPKLRDPESDLYKKTTERLNSIDRQLFESLQDEGKLTMLLMAAKLAEADLTKEGKLPNSALDKAKKQLEEKEAGKVLTGKKTIPTTAKKSDVDDLIGGKRSSSSDFF